MSEATRRTTTTRSATTSSDSSDSGGRRRARAARSDLPEFVEHLGHGSLGPVFTARLPLAAPLGHLPSPAALAAQSSSAAAPLVAVRQIPVAGPLHRAAVEAEIRALRECKHRNLLSYSACLPDSPTSILLVSDFCPAGSVADCLRLMPSAIPPFEESAVCLILAATLDALAYLHDRNIVHGNVKASNIFLCQSGIVKLGDMSLFSAIQPAAVAAPPASSRSQSHARPGNPVPSSTSSSSAAAVLSRHADAHHRSISHRTQAQPSPLPAAVAATGIEAVAANMGGSPYWLSPEIISGLGRTPKSDIWSLGITAIEITDGAPPHADIHPVHAMFKIPYRSSPTVRDPASVSSAFNHWIARCLIKDPEMRPSARSLLSQHPFILRARLMNPKRSSLEQTVDAILAQRRLLSANPSPHPLRIDPAPEPIQMQPQPWRDSITTSSTSSLRSDAPTSRKPHHTHQPLQQHEYAQSDRRQSASASQLQPTITSSAQPLSSTSRKTRMPREAPPSPLHSENSLMHANKPEDTHHAERDMLDFTTPLLSPLQIQAPPLHADLISPAAEHDPQPRNSMSASVPATMPSRVSTATTALPRHSSALGMPAHRHGNSDDAVLETLAMLNLSFPPMSVSSAAASRGPAASTPVPADTATGTARRRQRGAGHESPPLIAEDANEVAGRLKRRLVLTHAVYTCLILSLLCLLVLWK